MLIQSVGAGSTLLCVVNYWKTFWLKLFSAQCMTFMCSCTVTNLWKDTAGVHIYFTPSTIQYNTDIWPIYNWADIRNSLFFVCLFVLIFWVGCCFFDFILSSLLKSMLYGVCIRWTPVLCPKEIVLLYTIHYSTFAALAATSCVKNCDSVLAIFNLSCLRWSSRPLV